MTILYQTNPKGSGGDCLRTVFAMLMCKKQDELDDIPDFASDRGKHYEKRLKSYLDKENLHYQEMPFEAMNKNDTSNHMTGGECIAIARYKGIPHAMRGYLYHTILDNDRTHFYLHICYCPIRGELDVSQNDYDEEILGVGFLTRKLKTDSKDE